MEPVLGHEAGPLQQLAELERGEPAIAGVQERVDDAGVVLAVLVVGERPAQRMGAWQRAHHGAQQARMIAIAGVQSEQARDALHLEHAGPGPLGVDHEPQHAAWRQPGAQAPQRRGRVRQVHQYAVALDDVELADRPGRLVVQIDRRERDVLLAVYAAPPFGDA